MASHFPYDLRIGYIGEGLMTCRLAQYLPVQYEDGKSNAADLITRDGIKIEVKTDLLIPIYGNHYVEYRHNNRDSGISVTESEWWAIVTPTASLIVLTSDLKELAKGCEKSPQVRDGKTTHGLKVPMSKLLELEPVLRMEGHRVIFPERA